MAGDARKKWIMNDEVSREASGKGRIAEELPVAREGSPRTPRALARMARTGIYLVRGVPLELQQAARVRAVSEGTTLGQVLLKGLREYAAATWTPQRDDTVSGLKSPADRPQDLDPVLSRRKSDRT
jgi:hypothetical protein